MSTYLPELKALSRHKYEISLVDLKLAHNTGIFMLFVDMRGFIEFATICNSRRGLSKRHLTKFNDNAGS